MTDDQITLGTIGGVIGIVFGLIGGYSIGSMDLIEKKTQIQNVQQIPYDNSSALRINYESNLSIIVLKQEDGTYIPIDKVRDLEKTQIDDKYEGLQKKLIDEK